MMKYATRTRSLRSALLAAPLAAVIASCGGESVGDPETHLRSAQEALQKKDYRAAEIELRNATRGAPDNIDIRLQLADLYMKSNNPAAAEAQLITAKNRGAGDDVLAPVLAKALYMQGKVDDVLRQVPAGDRAPKSESVVRTYRGLAELALGNAERAAAMLDDAERLDSEAVEPKLARVQLLAAARDIAGAEARLDEALAAHPTNDQAVEQKARFLASRGDLKGATELFNRAVALNGYNSPAHLGLASLKLAGGDLDGALASVKAAQRVARGSGLASYLEAEIAVRKKDFAGADTILTRLRPAMDRMPQTYFLAGLVKYELGQLDQSAEYLNRYVARVPGNARAYAILGTIALRRGDGARAVEVAEAAAKIAPDDPAVKSLLSQAYYADGDSTRSLSLLTDAVNKQPDNTSLRTQLAVSRFRAGDGAAAVSELTTIFDSGVGTVGAGPPLIAAALASGHIDDAAKAAEDLVKTDPENSLYQGILGSVRIAQRDFVAAESIFAALLKKDASLSAARDNLAGVYWATNRRAEAKKLYQDRIAQDPADVASMQKLAQIHANEGAFDEALRLLESAQQTATADPTSGMQIVALYADQKKWPEMLRQVRVLQSAYPRDARVIDIAGRANMQAGDLQGAIAAYRQGVGIFPDSTVLQANYAIALFAAKDDANGFIALEKAVDLAPTNRALKAQLIERTFQAKGADAALALARAKTSATDPFGVVLVAEVLDRGGQYPAAAALLEKSQAENASQPVVLKLAELRQRHNEIPAAAKLLEDWLKAHPEDVAPRLTLAQLYGQTRNYDGAITHFERLSAERSSDPTILNDLAWNYLMKSDPRARATAEKAYRLAPQLPQIADTLGWIMTVQGDAANGVKHLQVASAALPTLNEVQYHYAVALSRTNKANDARALLQKILATNAEFEGKADARQLLERLGGAAARP